MKKIPREVIDIIDRNNKALIMDHIDELDAVFEEFSEVDIKLTGKLRRNDGKVIVANQISFSLGKVTGTTQETFDPNQPGLPFDE
jgi:hypothetical protein